MEDFNDEDELWKEPVTDTSLQKRETDCERGTCRFIHRSLVPLEKKFDPSTYIYVLGSIFF